ncbi:urease accessory protein ureD (plasmid) [Pandoraea oxalativorans]|uniref:Urease accessory protein UreD n=1 Tax=Pandoraea oxalativorans TaxID=573737 RepID=A0A0G3ICK2_9BURK|nr:urease accessory protein ureD [Pandoraea oxalativorans]
MANRWCAKLDLWFENDRSKTRLIRRRHTGPLAIQQPFYPEADGAAHVYLLHPPGGIAGGDRLSIHCHLASTARTLLTTPGAAKFYRSDENLSEQHVHIDVGAGAICEYLPQETIVFSGAHASMKTKVSLAADSIYIGWDLVSLGRPAAGERFHTGNFRQSVEIVREDVPIWFERLNLSGTRMLTAQPFVLAERPIMGTMVYAGPAIENAAERVRGALGEGACAVFSVSQLERIIVCRYLGARMSEGKSLFRRAWEVLRECAMGKRGVAPRIWST